MAVEGSVEAVAKKKDNPDRRYVNEKQGTV